MTDRNDDLAPKPAGIKEIANALGVSIGTVDRALHDRPGINALTRARVLKMAQTLGYKPNFAARHLKLNRKLQIAVNLPVEIASFFEALRGGVSEAAMPFSSAVDLQFRNYARFGQGDVEVFVQALEARVSGMIIAPGNPAVLKKWIHKAVLAHIPVVCVATDAPGTDRLTAISADPSTGGRMAAELMELYPKPVRRALLVAGDLNTADHADKARGFRDFAAASRSSMELASIVEAHDDPDRALRLTRDALSTDPQIDGVYVCTANSMPVIEALRETGRLGRTTLVTTDLFPELVPYLRSGEVLATLYQRPITQGRLAFQSLYRFLVEGVCPPLRRRLAPHIIMRSNLDLFLELKPEEADGAEYRAMPLPQVAKKTAR